MQYFSTNQQVIDINLILKYRSSRGSGDFTGVETLRTRFPHRLRVSKELQYLPSPDCTAVPLARLVPQGVRQKSLIQKSKAKKIRLLIFCRWSAYFRAPCASSVKPVM